MWHHAGSDDGEEVDDSVDGDGGGAFFKPQGLKLTFNLSASGSASARASTDTPDKSLTPQAL